MVETVQIEQTEIKLANGMQLSEAAEDMIDQAIAFCARQMGQDANAVIALLSTGSTIARDYCLYALARHAVAFLGSVDDHINTAYMVDYDTLCEGEIDPPFHQDVPALHLILRAERKTAALDSLITALGRALTYHYGHLLGRPHIQSLLDVQVIDEADVSGQTWPGTLLQALYHRPVQLWQR